MRLMAYAQRQDVVVLGVPRGGVVVAFEVAMALGAPLDVFLSRKLGVPGQTELAFGAVSASGERYLDEYILRTTGITNAQVEWITAEVRKELDRRATVYRGDRPPLDVWGKTVILVDDGVATGASVYAAIQALRQMQPAKLVLAVPVAPASAWDWLRTVVDEIVCLDRPDPFAAVGAFYRNFAQVEDAEVVELLQRAEAIPKNGRSALPGQRDRPYLISRAARCTLRLGLLRGLAGTGCLGFSLGHELTVLGGAVLFVPGAVVDLGVEVDPDQTLRLGGSNVAGVGRGWRRCLRRGRCGRLGRRQGWRGSPRIRRHRGRWGALACHRRRGHGSWFRRRHGRCRWRCSGSLCRGFLLRLGFRCGRGGRLGGRGLLSVVRSFLGCLRIRLLLRLCFRCFCRGFAAVGVASAALASLAALAAAFFCALVSVVLGVVVVVVCASTGCAKPRLAERTEPRATILIRLVFIVGRTP